MIITDYFGATIDGGEFFIEVEQPPSKDIFSHFTRRYPQCVYKLNPGSFRTTLNITVVFDGMRSNFPQACVLRINIFKVQPRQYQWGSITGLPLGI